MEHEVGTGQFDLTGGIRATMGVYRWSLTGGDANVEPKGPSMSITEHAPEAVHIADGEIPWVDIGNGNKMRLLQVRPTEGLWIIENIFQAGFAVQTHKHTGPVWGYTTRGAWKYAEYDYVNRAGSFLYEPAGSVHTLTCIEDDTQVWFHMYGANLNLDAEGNVESVADGASSLAAYFMLAEAQGLGRPNVIVG